MNYLIYILHIVSLIVNSGKLMQTAPLQLEVFLAELVRLTAVAVRCNNPWLAYRFERCLGFWFAWVVLAYWVVTACGFSVMHNFFHCCFDRDLKFCVHRLCSGTESVNNIFNTSGHFKELSVRILHINDSVSVIPHPRTVNREWVGKFNKLSSIPCSSIFISDDTPRHKFPWSSSSFNSPSVGKS